jgi:hypothetical protein
MSDAAVDGATEGNLDGLADSIGVRASLSLILGVSLLGIIVLGDCEGMSDADGTLFRFSDSIEIGALLPLLLGVSLFNNISVCERTLDG